MSNETVESASSQPAEVSNTNAKSDAPKNSNLSVAQAAQRLLNIESENAKAQRPTEQAAETPDQASDNSVNPDEATAESAEPSQEVETPDGEADVPSQDITPELQKKNRQAYRQRGRKTQSFGVTIGAVGSTDRRASKLPSPS
jgi:hypothetical protein